MKEFQDTSRTRVMISTWFYSEMKVKKTIFDWLLGIRLLLESRRCLPYLWNEN